MYTYQDLKECGDDERQRIEFVKRAIAEHISSPEYRIAKKAEAYYKHMNPDIAQVEKVIYDFRGVAHKNLYAANHKLMNAYYPLIIDMGTSHLLANGIAFENGSVKDDLGANFDKVIKDIFTDARNCGVSYGYYNGDQKKLIHFKYEEFKALPDEQTGIICAGIRFFRIDSTKPLTAVLYEADGYTEYVQPVGDDMQIRTGADGKSGKRRYNGVEISNGIQGVYEIDTDEESVLPIYPLYNLQKQSAIIGNVAILAAIDLVNSQLINDVSEDNLIYWILQGYGGMDELDDAKFLEILHRNHVAHTDSEQTITPHEITTQFAANEAGAVRLKRMIFDNMRGVMAETLQAGNLTATAISSAYSAQRLNSGLLEDEVREFMQGIFRIMGVDEFEKISFSYYETINSSESISNVIQSAQWLGDTVTTRLLASLNGVIDDLENIEKEKSADELGMYGMNTGNNTGIETGMQAAETGGSVDENEIKQEAPETIGKGLNGLQIQSVLAIIQQHTQQQISRKQAIALISAAIGISKEQAEDFFEDVND